MITLNLLEYCINIYVKYFKAFGTLKIFVMNWGMPQDWSDDIMVENWLDEKEIIFITTNVQIAQTVGNFVNFVLCSVTAENSRFFLKCSESTNSHINYQSRQIQNTFATVC